MSPSSAAWPGSATLGEVHAGDLLRLIVHLPLVLEFYDDPEVVASLLSRIQQMVPAGHIVSWTAQCDGSS